MLDAQKMANCSFLASFIYQIAIISERQVIHSTKCKKLLFGKIKYSQTSIIRSARDRRNPFE